MTVSATSVGDGASTDLSTVAGAAYGGHIHQRHDRYMDIASHRPHLIVHTGGNYSSQQQTATLNFTAIGPSTRITAASTAPGITITFRTFPFNYTTWTSGTIVTTVCSKDGDAYRYGFNGQMKTNEWAGIGNHTTAQFWEYDTRIGRRLNVDPVDHAEFSDVPIENIQNADFVETATLKKGANFITRDAGSAPGSANEGKGIEVVVDQGGTTNNVVTPIKR